MISRFSNITFLFLVSFYAQWMTCTAMQYHTQEKRALLGNVIKFCEANGKKFLMFTTSSQYEYKNMVHQVYEIFSSTQKRNMFSRYWNIDDDHPNFEYKPMDSIIILASNKDIQSNNETLNSYIELISETKIRSSILVISKNTKLEKINLDPIVKTLSTIKKNTFFYIVNHHLMENGTEILLWHQVISLQNEPHIILNQLEFDSMFRIIER